MKVELIRQRKGSALPLWRVTGWDCLDDLRGAVSELKSDSLEDMEVEIGELGEPWRFRTKRERMMFCEGLLAGVRRESQFEGLVGLVELMISRVNSSPNGKRSELLSDKEAIQLNLTQCGTAAMRERASSLVLALLNRHPE